MTDSSNVGISGVDPVRHRPRLLQRQSTGTDRLRALAQPAGRDLHDVRLGGAAAGMVDQNGNAPATQTVSVVDQGTETSNLQYDRPGSIQGITFRTRDYSNSLVASSADSVIVSNTGMQVAKQFTPVGGGRAASISTTSTLFPFTSPYAVYAGTCASNTPPAGPMLGNSTVPVGGAGTLAAPGYIQLPSLQVTVWSGTSTVPGTRLSAAKVTAKDTGCNFTRTLTTLDQQQRPGPKPAATSDSRTAPMTSAPRTPREPTRGPSPASSSTSAGATGTTLDIFLGGQPAGTCP